MEDITYVVNKLLFILINEDELKKRRKIDVNLYRILNSEKVNSKFINYLATSIDRIEKLSNDEESIRIIQDILFYIEYDLFTDFMWAKLSDNIKRQNDLREKISFSRKKILKYIFDNNLISEAVFEKENNYEIKKISD
ncbi:MAG: hypothetical protein PHF26_04000 [Candidatus Gracilibacteria bacterium]|nr:hypothetical protein [Candidatus Gracilibacteria bacterium]